MRSVTKNQGLKLLSVGIILAWIIAGCANYTIPGKDSGDKIKDNSCEGCHTDYEHLIEVYSPDTAAPVGGCGGEAPHYEPYDRVFLGGTGYDAFKASSHYSMGCTGCHNGVGDTGDKEEAHSGDWIASPSMFYEEKCAMCHQDIADNFATSLHNGTGQKRKVAIRSGLSGADEFDQLPAHQIAAYDAKCAICHGTCGNCHVVRPASGGGGLSHGHQFTKTPDMLNVCVTCHTSRGGHAYLGQDPSTEADVHLTENSFVCLACHDGEEIHGDGNPVDQRYAYTELPECEMCHPDLERANNYHTMHYGDFNCQVCHSQDYNNCGACHVKDGHAEYPSYMDYKIALNPIPDVKTAFDKFVLVRRTLAYPDNWVGYGEDLAYSNFDALPTYNFTTPHNILRWTERTEVENGTSCSSNCHIRQEGDSLINKDNYLWMEDLLDWEVGATGHITVDGQLPSSWTR
ncbi:MAG: hypothetical protein ACWGNV_06645 [Bacteroidales bacterium]